MSTKEEVLLKLVLDNFANIKEVLNATKDIEDFLTELKSHNSRDEISVILEKVKHLVDSLYDNSVKVKKDFYKHFNNLEIETSQDKENSRDSITNSENAIFEDNFLVVDAIEDQEQSKSNEGPVLENTEKTEVEANSVKSKSKSGGKESSNNGVIDNEDLNHTNKVGADNAAEAIVENRAESVSTLDADVDENVSSGVERVSSEKDKKGGSDNIIGKSHKSQVDNTEDHLGIDGDSSDSTESNISVDQSKCIAKKDLIDSKKNEDKSKKIIESNEITKEPRIRLVDLSKLIDPKPKKSVKFDSSIIILTSSDEENNTPKKKSEIKDQNGKLKPALKPSPQKIITVHLDTIIKEDERKRSMKNKHERDIEESESKSGRRKDKRNKNEKSEKKKNSSGREDSNKDNKGKHMKKENDSSTDSEMSDEEPSKKKKKTSNEKINKHDSDSSDCVIQNDSDSDMQEQSESPKSQNSRRSSRLNKNETKKAKQKEKLRTLFKRKPSKHGTSRFEIVNKKSTNSDSESDSDSGSKHLRKKKELTEDHLPDTSNLSDDENEELGTMEKSRKNKKQIHKVNMFNNVEDKKFSYEVYIPLPRIECEHIKEVYLKNKEVFKIKRLTNIKESKSSKRPRKNKNDTKSSSDSEKPTTKKSKKDMPEKEPANVETSDDEPLTDIAKKIVKEKDTEDVVPQKPIEDEERITDIVVDKMQCSVEKEKKSEESNNDPEDEKTEESTEKGVSENSSKCKDVEQQIPPNDSDETEENMQTSEIEEKTDEQNNKNTEEEDKTKSNDNPEEEKNSENNDNPEEKNSEKNDNPEEKNSENNDNPEEKNSEKNDNPEEKNSENINENDKEEDKNEDEGNSKSEDEGEKELENSNKQDKDSDKGDESKDDEDKDGGTGDKNSSTEDKNDDAEDENNDTEDKNDSTEDKDNNEEDKDQEKKNDEESTNDESENNKEKKKSSSDEIITLNIDSTDSEEDFSKYNARKEKSREELISDDEITSVVSKRKTKKKNKKVICDSDESDVEEIRSDSSSDKNKKSSEESNSSGEESVKKKPARRRIKRTKDSSSSSDDDRSTRKQIRKLIGKDALSETTKQAEAEEKERKARIAEKQKKYNQVYEELTDSKVEKLVLDYDEKEKKELLTVHKGITKKLKPHQASGIQFMWDACFESLQRTTSTKGSGCILAHCMGLGKTLQVIALAHTLLTNSQKSGVEKILVVCPVNTVLNWKAEFKKWMPKGSQIEVYELVSCKQNYERQYVVQEWHNDGGVLIIGYAMFRNLGNPDNKRISRKMRTTFQEGLVDPGPDLVVCDEGHLLKNEKTNLSIAMNRIKTLRRIVLTGTPLQNNLKEYWCMVQFIKPNLLGTYKEYLNRFVNPITNGQYTDSTQHDTILMRKRSHVLHKLLDGVVQRRDYSVLEPYLPPKHEYVLFVSLSEVQTKLYTHYMDRFARQNDGSNRTSFLFTDFQQLQRICTHPRVLLDKSKERKEKEYNSDSEGSLRDFIDDGEASDASSSASSSNSSSDSEGSDNDRKGKKSKKQQKTRVTRAQAALRKENNEESDSEVEQVQPKEWWQDYCDGEELDNINNSGKLFLLFQILKECEEIGDKVLVFSQSLYTLNCIEYFLQKIDEATQDGQPERVGGYSGSWSIGLDYFRLDGSSSCDNRATWCDNFNNPDNPRARLFLISTKAGGLGINLVAANRVIIFDVSWNPSHDIQSIYRVYRFGQTKPCYIYRFVSYGTMEMKIYERQVTKQAISKRVIDEQQIDRHYNQNDLQELYKCDLNPTERPIPLVPKDVLLGELLQKYEKTIHKYHLHQSLLENKEDEGLNEEERKAAWEEFENEKVLRKNTSSGFFGNFNMNAHAIAAALASIVRKDNPTWSEVQIKGIIPALVQQLQVQLTEGDMTMYLRVQKEMQMMQALQAQKMKEAYYQQQVMRMIQQQQQQAKLLGNLNIDPMQLASTQANLFNNHLANMAGGPSSAQPRHVSNDVIELND